MGQETGKVVQEPQSDDLSGQAIGPVDTKEPSEDFKPQSVIKSIFGKLLAEE